MCDNASLSGLEGLIWRSLGKLYNIANFLTTSLYFWYYTLVNYLLILFADLICSKNILIF